MLKTRLCELLGLEVPIILAPMGTCRSAELAAAVSNEGGLGGIGSLYPAHRDRPPKRHRKTSDRRLAMAEMGE
jgi:NAD(P)H-dependent flavin oxidoreductase YrpB (nitropropane dioxygenase family)